MTSIAFGPLADTDVSELVALLNDPHVRRHMPLAGGEWDEIRALDWARGKDAQWQQNGFGPWAIRIDGAFAGWGGFQKEGEEVDLGLVLLPRYWDTAPGSSVSYSEGARHCGSATSPSSCRPAGCA